MEYALADIRDQVRLEVKRSWLELKDAEGQVGVTVKAIAQADENFRISQERYKEQVGTATEVLDAQTLLTRARADHANALGDYQIGYARLERAMGMTLSQGQ
ncbi:MAG TPA: TolC family protein, partial [Deltaproteobacteria bacterium]|nr:TolC family protein [Deltaproteobacteria bacterium]